VIRAYRGWLILACMLCLSPVSAQTLLVGNKSGDSVSLIDLAAGETVATALTGPGPHEIAVSGDGKLAVVTNYGTAEAPGNTLSVIEVEQGRTVGHIDLGKHTRPHGILFLPDSRRVLVTTEGSRSLLQVDIYLGLVEKVIPTGQSGSHMIAYDVSGRRAYVANIASASISLIDVNHADLLAYEASGIGTEGIALALNGRDLWATNRGEDTVSLFDARYLRRLEQLPVAGFPIRAELLPDDSALLVISARSGVLTVIDTASRKIIRTVDLGLQANMNESAMLADQFPESSIPIGLEIAPDGERIWIAHAGADRVQELETENWSQTRLLEAGREPDGMGYSQLSVQPDPELEVPAVPPTQYQD
jgi:YVTN family beta-propeller protein